MLRMYLRTVLTLVFLVGAAAARAGTASSSFGPGTTYLYALSSSANNEVTPADIDILAYRISPEGTLVPVPGSPFTSGEAGAITAQSIAAAASGKFLYIATYSRIVGFRIDPASGALTPLPGSPWQPYAGDTFVTFDSKRGPAYSGSELESVAVNPGGSLAYVGGNCALGGKSVGGRYTPECLLFGFHIGANGALTATPGSPYDVSQYPGDVLFNPSGPSILIADGGTNFPVRSNGQVAAATDGAWTGNDGFSAVSPKRPLLFHVTRRHQTVVIPFGGAQTQDVTPSVFSTRIPTNGKRKQLSALRVDAAHVGAIAVNPAGTFLVVGGQEIVADGRNYNVVTYQIQADGTLSPLGGALVGGSADAPEPMVTALAFDRSGRLLVIATQSPNALSAYHVGADGSVTPASRFRYNLQDASVFSMAVVQPGGAR